MRNEDLENLRHSLAHLLAAAVLELYPGTKNAIGPAIENGFYYDFDVAGNITEEDLPRIENEMRKILKTWDRFEKIDETKDSAQSRYIGNEYKNELIQEIDSRGEDLTSYKSGDFIDLCRGGHVKSANDINPDSFKLTHIAGAYWRGNEKNPMLIRIYGVAFKTKDELDKHLILMEEAKKRDHRKIGQELELFTTSEEIGPGLILWLPKGTIIKEEMEKFGKEIEEKENYQRISTPHIAKEKLFITSGHLPYYADDMYPPMKSEEGDYYLKPMNCPNAHMVYKFRKRSYRELPLRLAEFGTVYRYEKSGELFGLMRVRGMTQNDAHIYCIEERAVEELIKVINLHQYYYDIFEIKDYYIELALPDFKKKKDKYFDDPEGWEKAIKVLKEAAKKSKIDVVENVGGAAFYGPKFDFNIKSAIGKEFGASTNQLDFGSGKRFGLTYVDKDGSEKTVPYIIHRAPLGSDERFIGFLIEHYAGAFPVWLSPTQVAVLPIGEKHKDYAREVAEKLKENKVRVEIFGADETLSKRVREAELQKVPYILVVGDEEKESGSVAVRRRGSKDQEKISVSGFIASVVKEARNRK